MIGGIIIGLGSYAAVNVAAYFTLGKPLDKVMERGNIAVKILTAVLAGPATLMNKIYPASKIKENKLAKKREKEEARKEFDQYTKEIVRGETEANAYRFMNMYHKAKGVKTATESIKKSKRKLKQPHSSVAGHLLKLSKTLEKVNEPMKKHMIKETKRMKKYRDLCEKNNGYSSLDDINLGR